MIRRRGEDFWLMHSKWEAVGGDVTMIASDDTIGGRTRNTSWLVRPHEVDYLSQSIGTYRPILGKVHSAVSGRVK